MGIKILNNKKLEGTYMIYDREDKVLSFSRKAVDDVRNFCIGQVVNGEVGGKPLSHWIGLVRKKVKIG